ncbi:MAG TPA: HTTM domain-containing protein [Bacteroidia bacterium]|nr:HTTM domain-containing protein [Bacteroidia bacterium]
MNRFNTYLNKPIQKEALEWFRIGFGLIILLQVYSFVKVDFVNNFILLPEFNLKWDGFEWIGLLPDTVMKSLPLILFGAGVGILIKKTFKVSIILFTVCFWYIVLVERSYFNNHMYLLCLIGTVLCFYDPTKKDARNWVLFLLKFLIILVYFYGGTNKLNADWLIAHEPVRTILSNAGNAHSINIAKDNWMVLLLVYGGVIIDLGASITLWIKSTRKYAIYVLSIFHLSNHFIFNFGESGDIGVFPFFMIMANCLFVPAETLSALRSRHLGKAKKTINDSKGTNDLKPMGIMLLSMFIVFQCFFPLRHHAIKGDVDWTGIGFQFAWRMKLRTKATDVKIFAKADDQPNEVRIQPQGFLNITQWNDAKLNPLVMHQFVKKLEAYFRSKGASNPIIRVEMSNGLNGRSQQAIVDFSTDWTKLKTNKTGANDWILPELNDQ